ncbi:MAG: outer membrane beta-barrel protein, partial [Pseudomonadota bacterium]
FLYGVADDDFTITDEEFGAIEASVGLNYLVGAYGRAIWPVTERFDLFARAGWVQAELEADATAQGESASISESGSGYALGIGATIGLTDRFYLRADYTRYTIEGSDTDGFLIGGGVKF